MKSPFPGMDPYIEACDLWGDFHQGVIAEIKHALARSAPERYLVRTGERSYVVFVEAEGKEARPFLPDVSVVTERRQKPSKKKGGAAVAEMPGEVKPIRMRAFLDEWHREAFVEIYEAKPEQRLVTSIEVLSPSNKRAGSPGWDVYQRKRQSLMLDGVNLIEIDLLRGGQRMPMLDRWPDSPYTLMVARGNEPGVCLVWPASYQTPLPRIPVPLARPDPDLSLDLQPMIEAVYEEARYARSIDYRRALSPRPGAEEAAWLEEHLRPQRRGKR